MVTQIIITKGWKLIKQYDFVFTLSPGDTVDYKGMEYTVKSCFLDIGSDTMQILLKE